MVQISCNKSGISFTEIATVQIINEHASLSKDYYFIPDTIIFSINIIFRESTTAAKFLCTSIFYALRI